QMNTAPQPLSYNDLDDMSLIAFTFGLGDEQGDEIITVEVGKGVKAEISLEFKEPKGISIVEGMVTMGRVKDEAKEEWVVSVPFPQVEGKHSQIQSGKLPQVNPFIEPIIYEEKGQDPMNKIDECLHQEIKESHWMWDNRKKRSKGTHEIGVEKKTTKPKAFNVVIKDSRKLE
ncbi:hypothetical protein PIB30_044245, partial [Stylosanthes scabra]|nr:hypothetical protein [Stylosanthes scabra]